MIVWISVVPLILHAEMSVKMTSPVSILVTRSTGAADVIVHAKLNVPPVVRVHMILASVQNLREMKSVSTLGSPKLKSVKLIVRKQLSGV